MFYKTKYYDPLRATPKHTCGGSSIHELGALCGRKDQTGVDCWTAHKAAEMLRD